ncbi:hypothetical protein ABKN59_011703 [Abortiporus biennis]
MAKEHFGWCIRAGVILWWLRLHSKEKERRRNDQASMVVNGGRPSARTETEGYGTQTHTPKQWRSLVNFIQFHSRYFKAFTSP